MKVFVNLNFKIHHKFTKRLVYIFTISNNIQKQKRVVLCYNFVALKLSPVLFVYYIYSIFFGDKLFYLRISTKYYGDYHFNFFFVLFYFLVLILVLKPLVLIIIMWYELRNFIGATAHVKFKVWANYTNYIKNFKVNLRMAAPSVLGA